MPSIGNNRMHQAFGDYHPGREFKKVNPHFSIATATHKDELRTVYPNAPFSIFDLKPSDHLTIPFQKERIDSHKGIFHFPAAGTEDPAGLFTKKSDKGLLDGVLSYLPITSVATGYFKAAKAVKAWYTRVCKNEGNQTEYGYTLNLQKGDDVVRIDSRESGAKDKMQAMIAEGYKPVSAVRHVYSVDLNRSDKIGLTAHYTALFTRGLFEMASLGLLGPVFLPIDLAKDALQLAMGPTKMKEPNLEPEREGIKKRDFAEFGALVAVATGVALVPIWGPPAGVVGGAILSHRILKKFI